MDKKTVSKILTKRIKDYIEGYIDFQIKEYMKPNDNNVVMFSTGDCWCCTMRDIRLTTFYKNLEFLKGAMGVNHTLNHLDEMYFVPSLLKNALYFTSEVPERTASTMRMEMERMSTFTMEKTLKEYFKNLKPLLIQVAIKDVYGEYKFLYERS
jgi:hypothetical protein